MFRLFPEYSKLSLVSVSLTCLMQGEKAGLTRAGCGRPRAPPRSPPALSPFLILQGNNCLTPRAAGLPHGAAGPGPCLGQNLGPPWGWSIVLHEYLLTTKTHPPFPHQTLSLGPHHLWITSSVASDEVSTAERQERCPATGEGPSGSPSLNPDPDPGPLCPPHPQTVSRPFL